jgi:hypothetical protein
VALLKSLADHVFDPNSHTSGSWLEKLEWMGYPTSIKWTFQNLADSSIRYGSHAVILLHFGETAFLVTLEDDGQSISDNERS